MKQFTTIKVGYTYSRMYGCRGEYFTTIIINGAKTASIHFHGMYGAEERVATELKEAGFKPFYTPSDYGQMVARDVWQGFKSEDEILKELPAVIKEMRNRAQ